MHQHKGDYGIDGSFKTIPAGAQFGALAVQAAALSLWAAVSWAKGKRRKAALAGAGGLGIAAHTTLYLYATRTGKFVVWDRILDGLRLQGDETVLDMGCGRGAVLVAAAKRLPRGRVIGIDLWRPDQTDNSPSATLKNADLEKVGDRIEVRTADMTALPFDDDSVDAVVSSLAIHNIPSREGRRRALREAVRVLRPGGRLAIADLWETRQHAAELRRLGWPDVQRRNLGWRMWYGGPWAATRLVTATKPG
ncbi:class I SAM-dependent methyltransferase [Mycobacterium branderi]|uniref:SAM-dependent methyltransferase n=1 Tax=Mycobacterium branderi TaxID=43348 RepID=A0A7I7W180_9MYCO|nr:class I SAM-dependent methyltransferase [Mycobacterium branderi]MCV7233401.1 class I SAM-dependent methyltransferase [Mycobacterium branderi]ORA41778.1 SAM-dependent methyltransferase [Mycobacterium branderi]BBZ10515.1 type 11 methyltransferase [Mycobacterium branderi]